MNNGFAPYEVDLGQLRGTYGCKDLKLLQEIESKFSLLFAQNRNRFHREIVQGAPALEEALSRLIDGTVPKNGYGFQYAYALEVLCRHFGTLLPNDAVRNCDWRGQQLLAQALSARGYTEVFPLQKLLFGGPPVPIPLPETFPGISTFEVAEIEKWHHSIRDLDLDYPSERITRVLTQIRSWFMLAYLNHHAVVAFYYQLETIDTGVEMMKTTAVPSKTS